MISDPIFGDDSSIASPIRVTSPAAYPLGPDHSQETRMDANR